MTSLSLLGNLKVFNMVSLFASATSIESDMTSRELVMEGPFFEGRTTRVKSPYKRSVFKMIMMKHGRLSAS